MWSSGNGSARATPSCRWSVISQKSDDLVREGTALKLMCGHLGVLRQPYHRWLANGHCQQKRTDTPAHL